MNKVSRDSQIEGLAWSYSVPVAYPVDVCDERQTGAFADKVLHLIVLYRHTFQTLCDAYTKRE